MDWRSWVYNKLSTNGPVLALVPIESIYGGGSLNGAPANRPFIVIQLGTESPSIRDGFEAVATKQLLSIYVHDEPGDYLRTGQVLAAIRKALVGQVSDPTGIATEWLGDSTDFANDTYKTVMRYAEFQLIGKVA